MKRIQRNISAVLIVGSLLPLSTYIQYPENKIKIHCRERDYISFLINPLDWTFSPEIISMEIEQKKIEMTIDEFEKMLDTSDEYITIENEKINVKELKDYSRKLLNSITSKQSVYSSKITIIICETLIILSFGLNIIVNPRQIYRKYEKTKKLS